MSWVSRLAAVHGAFWVADPWYRIWWYAWPAALAILISGWIYTDKPNFGGPGSESQADWAKPVALATPIPTRNSPVLANWPEKLHGDVATCFSRAPDIYPLVDACTRLIESGEVNNPQRSSAYNQRGFLRRVKDPVRALEDVETALKIVPDLPYALGNRAYIYIGQGKFDAAIQDLNKAIEQFPPAASGPARHLRGLAYFKLGNYEKADAELNEALRLDPNNPDPLMARGELEQAQKNNEAALRDFDEYSRRLPRDPRGLMGRASVLESTGHVDEALVALENALKLDPSNARAIALRDRITEQKRSLDRSKSGAPAAEKQEQAARLMPSPRQDDDGAAPTTIAPQRAMLYDEDLSGVTGRKVAGSVIWRTEQAGDNIDRDLRADIEIPDRNLKLTLSLHRNRDPSLHASHTMDIAFAYSVASPSLRVNSIPGILMKTDERARGIPLAGLVVKVTDGVFLFGLSDVEADRTRNLSILKEQRWLDIPLVYSNQRRAILAIEKGTSGDHAFEAAFSSWEKTRY